MNEQLDTILRDYKNGQKLDGSGDLYTIVDARQSLLQLTQSEYKRGYNQALVDILEHFRHQRTTIQHKEYDKCLKEVSDRIKELKEGLNK